MGELIAHRKEVKMTIKELKKFFKENNIDYYEHDVKDVLCVRRCEIGAGGYDYEDAATPIIIKEKKFKFLANEKNVYIEDCEFCCGCGGW